jgi:anti-anti-sigma factor
VSRIGPSRSGRDNAHFGIDVFILDDVTWVLVSGEVDLAAAAELAEALHPRSGSGAMIADLRGVDFVDCGGMEVLLRARIRADADGLDLRILASGPVRRLADLLGLGDHLGLGVPAGHSARTLA